MATLRFRHQPHVADCRLAVWGADPERLVANAVLGTLRQAVGGGVAVGPPKWHTISTWPPDIEGQLVAAVNEALYLLYSKQRVAVEFELRGEHGWLATVPLGDRRIHREIKAATFHSLASRRRRSGFFATLTLDL